MAAICDHYSKSTGNLGLNELSHCKSVILEPLPQLNSNARVLK